MQQAPSAHIPCLDLALICNVFQFILSPVLGVIRPVAGFSWRRISVDKKWQPTRRADLWYLVRRSRRGGGDSNKWKVESSLLIVTFYRSPTAARQKPLFICRKKFQRHTPRSCVFTEIDCLCPPRLLRYGHFGIHIQQCKLHPLQQSPVTRAGLEAAAQRHGPAASSNWRCTAQQH
ncbi:hypothetical protein DPEC_G00371030 [Dallia pectoralis]|nr:hypothetical protein DPEC_G00371030 [Dallia pectoralis]